MTTRPLRRYTYCSDGPQIYRESFAIVRAETDLSGVPADAEHIAVRMVHAAGQPDLTRDLMIHPDFVADGRAALLAGAPVFVDSTMVDAGITRSRLPAGNEVICRLHDHRVEQLAASWGTTRSAAAVSLWGDALEGAVVAIGNAPTALFHLLEWICEGGPRPAAIVGVPVGFVGSAESKQALIDHEAGISYVVVTGRRGGAALAASAVNALAGGRT
ncbi:MAG TPA: precorrin-8X methylmutase [Nakamurella sp.]|jgi:precorrin-8X/cobalt-precorrin-8 methylmutase